MNVISVPKDLGGDLRNDIQGVAKGTLTAMHWGKSQEGKPKVTIEFILTEDIPGLEPPTTGEKVLESCSLQPQALWKLNIYYKGAKEEDLPSGDHSFEAFQAIVEEALLETEWDLDLMVGMDNKNNPRTQIRKAIFVG